jgi:hypothetical protein
MVTDIHTCPYCGSKTDRPLIFTYSVQKIFNYIWDNPWCTTKDMRRDLAYGTRTSNVVVMHLSRIHEGLASTEYEIFRRDPKQEQAIHDTGAPNVLT